MDLEEERVTGNLAIRSDQQTGITSTHVEQTESSEDNREWLKHFAPSISTCPTETPRCHNDCTFGTRKQ